MKNILKKGWKYITNKEFRFLVNSKIGLYDKMPDDKYLKKQFKIKMGYDLDLESPKTFNEKLQWLKLNDRKPEYTTMVDKYKVREYISKTIGEEYLVPLLGVYNNANEIDFDELPNQFVLKCNHNSGGLCVCKDKSKLNIKKVKRDLNKALKEDYYLSGREWPYKNVERKIICEKYMEDEETQELRDYKFFCFNGKPEFMFIASERNKADEETKFDFYDMNFKHLDLINGHPNSKQEIKKPKNFEKMKWLSERLSANINHVRVDFYECNSKIYFGEMTFFHWGGFVKFKPEEWDFKFGDLLKISIKEND